jgi:hypothetical protein
MSFDPANAFDSIESAHEFVALLADAVEDSKREIEADVQREAALNFPRRLEALRLALYSLEKLHSHVSKSRRILNDLRSVRRLLFKERTGALTAPPKAIRTASPPPPITSSNGRNGGVAAA